MVPLARIERATSPLPRECSTTELQRRISLLPLPSMPRPAHGAGEGNRTLVVSLEGFCSTIELHPHLAACCPLTIAGPSSALHILVEGEGFEPSKAEPSDLQSDPFDRSGTPPLTAREPLRREPLRTLRTKPLIMLGFLYRVKLGWRMYLAYSPSAPETGPDPGKISAPTLAGLAAPQNGAPFRRTPDDPYTPHSSYPSFLSPGCFAMPDCGSPRSRALRDYRLPDRRNESRNA